MAKSKETVLGVLFSLISGALYVGILYYTPRENFLSLMGQWGGLFLLYGLLLWHFSSYANPGKIRLWMGVGVFFRLLALFALPLLSDDYFRFIWDGTLLGAGENPYLQLPVHYWEDPEAMVRLGLTEELYQSLNSKAYFTVYPPFLQFIFWIGASVFPGSIYGAVLTMKLFVFAAELGTIGMLNRWLTKYEKPRHWLLWYVLNPLIIVELTGNLHFEALMIFFLLGALWLLQQKKWLWSSLVFSFAVTSKLLPLIVLPLLIRRLGWRQTIIYGALVGLWSLLQFLPIFDLETFLHIKESIGLYVSVFEFNASIYYVIREIGQAMVGYNPIGYVGPALSILVLLLIFDHSFRERKTDWAFLPQSISRIYLIYFAFASIVHPWYVSTLVAFGSLSRLRFPMVWSALIPLSYIAYRYPPWVEENFWLIALEYLLVFGFVIYESDRGFNRNLGLNAKVKRRED
jgi:alpha-1,6-mannosyltransferase